MGAVAPAFERQRRLRAVKCLHLGLFVEGKHHRPLRWVEVHPDHIQKLREKLRVGRQLERVDTPRRQTIRTPHPTDRFVADSKLGSECARRPVRCAAGRAGRACRLHDPFSQIRIQRHLPAPAWGDPPDTRDPLHAKPLTPRPDRHRAHPDPTTDLVRANPVGGKQQRLGHTNLPVLTGRCAPDLLQGLALLWRHLKGWGRR